MSTDLPLEYNFVCKCSLMVPWRHALRETPLAELCPGHAWHSKGSSRDPFEIQRYQYFARQVSNQLWEGCKRENGRCCRIKAMDHSSARLRFYKVLVESASFVWYESITWSSLLLYVSLQTPRGRLFRSIYQSSRLDQTLKCKGYRSNRSHWMKLEHWEGDWRTELCTRPQDAYSTVALKIYCTLWYFRCPPFAFITACTLLGMLSTSGTKTEESMLSQLSFKTTHNSARLIVRPPFSLRANQRRWNSRFKRDQQFSIGLRSGEFAG